MSDTVRIRIEVYTGYVGATHEEEIEVDRDKWEAMSEAERDEFMTPEIQDVISNHIEGSWEVIKD